MVRYTVQGVGQWCHDIHDNIFEHMYIPDVPTHGNVLECNADSSGGAINQPQNTPNVVYNNIMRHDDPGWVGSGDPHFWFCPTQIPEYWFNNLVYDASPNGGNGWAYAGPPTYGCSNTGGQVMFNNTFVDFIQACNPSTVNHGGQYLTVLNEHLINTPYNTGGSAPCTGFGNATNIVQTDAQATTQGYTTGSSGTVGNGNNCANDTTTPCIPTASSNATVVAGANHQAYCTTLATYAEYAIATEAASACKFDTTDGCTYVTSTHSMNCPAQTATSRPVSAAWDSGAYQYAAGGSGAGAGVTPPTLTFANQIINTSSNPQTITITSNGTASLVVSAISMATGSNFSEAAGTCSAVPFTLTVGSSCTVTVTFKPIVTGATIDKLSVTDNAGSQLVNVSGTGYNPAAIQQTQFTVCGSQVYLSTGTTCTIPATASPSVVLFYWLSNNNSGRGYYFKSDRQRLGRQRCVHANLLSPFNQYYAQYRFRHVVCQCRGWSHAGNHFPERECFRECVPCPGHQC